MRVVGLDSLGECCSFVAQCVLLILNGSGDAFQYLAGGGVETIGFEDT